MQHIYDLTQARQEQPSLVTIGVFDGVHRGHQHLIERLVTDAHSAGRQAVVLTFFPHPDVVLRGLRGRYYLTTPEQRADQLGRLGVDLVVTQRFDEAFRQIRAAEYINQLLQHLKMAVLCVGADFAMGYQREGDVPFLQQQGAEKGFTLHVIDLVSRNGEETISSTAVRSAIQAGDVEQANKWLGRAYALSGEVVHGDHRGRTIGFPTANIRVWEEQVIPANGVYACWAYISGQRYMAVTNIGVRPTFAGEGVTIEAHLLDFNREIYGETLTITFEKRLRAEQRFNGIQELIAQIAADAQAGRDYLAQMS